jgi:CPA2 family monovalent cation:H+ antiporter-2
MRISAWDAHTDQDQRAGQGDEMETEPAVEQVEQAVEQAVEQIAHGAQIGEVLILLATAVISVLLLQRLRVSPIIGYLLGGALIGPHGLGLIANIETVQGLAEFGVVFLLFTIGIELSVRRLWVMRRLVFGLGSAQVFLTAIPIGVIAWFAGASIDASIVIGSALALSSTALVLQVLIDRGEISDRFGRAAFAILLMQDLAVVPFLVLVPLLGEGTGSLPALLQALGFAALQAIVVIGLVVAIGRYLLRPVIDQVAAMRNPEVFAVLVLLIVIGIGFMTSLAGLSMGLGAFLAGLLLAESPYRHQIEANIRPFRGILLGLFFMTVGAMIDAGALLERAPLVIAILFGLVAGKALIGALMARIFGLIGVDAVRVGLMVANCGEFGFVIFAAATATGLIDPETGTLLTLCVALSMLAPPLLSVLGERLARFRQPEHDGASETLAEEAHEFNAHAVILGFGRMGQTVARLFDAAKVRWIALDLDARHVARAHQRGFPVYFGDGTEHAVLDAAGAGRACVIVVTLDNAVAVERAVEAARLVRPDLPIAARARDQNQVLRLEKLGAEIVIPETVEASIQLGLQSLAASGNEAGDMEALLVEIRRQGGQLIAAADEEQR